jgi:hypothetical protein
MILEREGIVCRDEEKSRNNIFALWIAGSGWMLSVMRPQSSMGQIQGVRRLVPHVFCLGQPGQPPPKPWRPPF